MLILYLVYSGFLQLTVKEECTSLVRTAPHRHGHSLILSVRTMRWVQAFVTSCSLSSKSNVSSSFSGPIVKLHFKLYSTCMKAQDYHYDWNMKMMIFHQVVWCGYVCICFFFITKYYWLITKLTTQDWHLQQIVFMRHKRCLKRLQTDLTQFFG